MLESIKLEKLFHEDHARGGRGDFAKGGAIDCAESRIAGGRATVATNTSQRINVFWRRYILGAPISLEIFD
jgi:hypothetical protein